MGFRYKANFLQYNIKLVLHKLIVNILIMLAPLLWSVVLVHREAVMVKVCLDSRISLDNSTFVEFWRIKMQSSDGQPWVKNVKEISPLAILKSWILYIKKWKCVFNTFLCRQILNFHRQNKMTKCLSIF